MDLRILIVDDEEELVQTLVERLELRGIPADGVTNGHEALERIYEQPYDVVLLDVKMPGLGGLEVIRKIKEKWPRVQVVLLTGHGSKQDAEEGRQLGAFEYLMKPVKIDALVDILKAAAGKLKRAES